MVAMMIPEATPLHKVTIIPRGMALGVTMFLPTSDQFDFNKKQAEAQIAVGMAGRVADEVFCHMLSAGASNDIEKATDLARRMVCDWGMSELGPLSFGKKEEQIFLGREIAQHRDYSEATAIRIDEQVRKLVEQATRKLARSSRSNAAAIERVAMALLEREVLDQRRSSAAGGRQGTAGVHAAPSRHGAERRRCAAGDQAGAAAPGSGNARRRAATGLIPQLSPSTSFDLDGTLVDSARGYLRARFKRLSLRYGRKRCHRCSAAALHRSASARNVPRPGLRRRIEIDPMIAHYRRIYLEPEARSDAGVSGRRREMLAALGGKKIDSHHQGHAHDSRGAGTVRADPAFRSRAGNRRISGQARAGRDSCGPSQALGAVPRNACWWAIPPADMEAGRRAGVRTCAVRWGYGDVAEMARWSPDYWIAEPAELLSHAQ